jgi:hypothetical protein
MSAIRRCAEPRAHGPSIGVTGLAMTFVWVVIFFFFFFFFFASAGASAAYLTVSETWPIEIRAEAIAVFSRSPRSPARADRRSTGR